MSHGTNCDNSHSPLHSHTHTTHAAHTPHHTSSRSQQLITDPLKATLHSSSSSSSSSPSSTTNTSSNNDKNLLTLVYILLFLLFGIIVFLASYGNFLLQPSSSSKTSLETQSKIINTTTTSSSSSSSSSECPELVEVPQVTVQDLLPEVVTAPQIQELIKEYLSSHSQIILSEQQLNSAAQAVDASQVSKETFQDWYRELTENTTDDVSVLNKVEDHVRSAQNELLELITRELAVVTAKLDQLTQSVSSTESYLDSVHETTEDLNHLQQLIDQVSEEKLALYNADRTGKIDYANYYGGGHVLYSSQNQPVAQGSDNLFAGLFDSLAVSKPPITMLDARMTPGSCWPMSGSQGWAVVELRDAILTSSISIEHIPVSITPTYKSAPKHVRVWGLRGEESPIGAGPHGFAKEGQPLCDLVYDVQGKPLQEVNCESKIPHKYVALEILSNHGAEYTCLYRFRVHGNHP